MKANALPTAKELNHLFTYDPTSPSSLRWNNPISRQMRRGDVAGAKNSDGYYQVSISCKRYRVHRIIYKMHHDTCIVDSVIDHVNRDRSDNKIDNLRRCTSAENQRNYGLLERNTTGSAGVRKARHGKWHASISVAGKRKHLGYYVKKSDAISARKNAEREFYGEFAPN